MGRMWKLIKLETRPSVPDRVKWVNMMQTEGKMEYGSHKN